MKKMGAKDKIIKIAKEFAKKTVLDKEPMISGWENVESKVDMEFNLNSFQYLVMAIIEFLDKKREK